MYLILINFLFFSLLNTNVFASGKWYASCADNGENCRREKVDALHIEKEKTLKDRGLACFEVSVKDELPDGTIVSRVTFYECWINNDTVLRLRPSKSFELLRLVPGIASE